MTAEIEVLREDCLAESGCVEGSGCGTGDQGFLGLVEELPGRPEVEVKVVVRGAKPRRPPPCCSCDCWL